MVSPPSPAKSLFDARSSKTTPERSLSEKPASSDSRTRAVKDSLKSLTEKAFHDLQQGKALNALDEALLHLKGDVVVLGGYRGSKLYATATDRQLWPSVRAGLKLVKVDLELGLDPEDDQNAEETVYAPKMFSHLGPVDIWRRLIKWLRESEPAKRGSLRIWEYGWDWRLHPSVSSLKLQEFVQGLPCNQNINAEPHEGAIAIAHSLGGLITRHAVNVQPELFAGVIYVGTPQAVPTILGPLRNGDAVLLSRQIFSAQANLTFRTSMLLLPLHGRCFKNKYTREDIILDYFDYNTWIEHRLSPCVKEPVRCMEERGRKRISLRRAQTTSSASTTQTTEDNRLLPRRRRQSSSALIDVRGGYRKPSILHRARTTFRRPFESVGDELEQSLEGGMQPQMTKSSVRKQPKAPITMSDKDAIEYLKRVLPQIKQFKLDLDHDPDLEARGLYPPMAVVYGACYPTISTILVPGMESIKNEDTYGDVVHSEGDGVVLATEAMLPSGYKYAIGGLVESDRSHTGLLGDFDAIGQALLAIIRARYVKNGTL